MTTKTGKLLEALQTQNQVPFRRIRQQILVLMPEIIEATNAGYSLAAIWKTLKQDGRFNGGYNPFCRHIREVMESSKTASLKEKVEREVSYEVQPDGVEKKEGEPIKRNFIWPNKKSRGELLGIE